VEAAAVTDLPEGEVRALAGFASKVNEKSVNATKMHKEHSKY